MGFSLDGLFNAAGRGIDLFGGYKVAREQSEIDRVLAQTSLSRANAAFEEQKRKAGRESMLQNTIIWVGVAAAFATVAAFVGGIFGKRKR